MAWFNNVNVNQSIAILQKKIQDNFQYLYNIFDSGVSIDGGSADRTGVNYFDGGGA